MMKILVIFVLIMAIVVISISAFEWNILKFGSDGGHFSTIIHEKIIQNKENITRYKRQTTEPYPDCVNLWTQYSGTEDLTIEGIPVDALNAEPAYIGRAPDKTLSKIYKKTTGYCIYLNSNECSQTFEFLTKIIDYDYAWVASQNGQDVVNSVQNIVSSSYKSVGKISKDNQIFVGLIVPAAGLNYLNEVSNIYETASTGYQVLTCISLLVETTTAPSVTTTAPLDTTTIPADTTTIPADTTTIPADTTTIPADTTTIPADTTTIPADTTTIPADTTTIPADTTTIPADTTTILADTTTISADTTTIPADTTTIPADTTTILADTTTILADTTTIPADTTTIPADTTTIPADTTTIPADTTTILADTTTIPADTTTILADTTTILTDTTTIPADTTSIPADATTIPADTTSIPAVTTTEPYPNCVNLWTQYSGTEDLTIEGIPVDALNAEPAYIGRAPDKTLSKIYKKTTGYCIYLNSNECSQTFEFLTKIIDYDYAWVASQNGQDVVNSVQNIVSSSYKSVGKISKDNQIFVGLVVPAAGLNYLNEVSNIYETASTGYQVLTCISLLVATTTAPSVTTTAPLDATTILADTTTIPVDTTTIPADTTTIPTDTTTIPADTTTIPADTTTIPTDTTTIPTDTTTIPADTTTIPAVTTTEPYPNCVNLWTQYSGTEDLTIEGIPVDALNAEPAYIGRAPDKTLSKIYKKTTGYCIYLNSNECSQTFEFLTKIIDYDYAWVASQNGQDVVNSVQNIVSSSYKSVGKISKDNQIFVGLVVPAAGLNYLNEVSNIYETASTGYQVLTCISLLVATTTAPSVTTTAPLDTTTIPTDTTTIPADTTTIPADTTTIPADKTTIPADTTTIPADTTTIPADTTTIPADTTTIPADTTTIPADTTTIPADTTTIPADTTTIPADTTTIPADTTTIPADTTTIPADTTTIPADTTTISADTTTIPADTTTIPADTTTIPADTTTISADTTTIPADTTTIPADTTTIPADTTTIPADTTTIPADTTTIPADTTTIPADTTTITLETSTVPLITTILPTTIAPVTVPPVTFTTTTTVPFTLPTSSGSSDQIVIGSIFVSVNFVFGQVSQIINVRIIFVQRIEFINNIATSCASRIADLITKCRNGGCKRRFG